HAMPAALEDAERAVGIQDGPAVVVVIAGLWNPLRIAHLDRQIGHRWRCHREEPEAFTRLGLDRVLERNIARLAGDGRTDELHPVFGAAQECQARYIALRRARGPEVGVTGHPGPTERLWFACVRRLGQRSLARRAGCRGRGIR